MADNPVQFETIELTNPNYELSREQFERLLTPPRANRIEKVQGKDYLPQHEVRAELSRTFGPGNWDSQVIEMTLLWEYDENAEKDVDTQRWHVGYRAGVRLRIRDMLGRPVAEFTEYHFDEKVGPSRNDCHGNAMTSAASYALRRCAMGIGDNLGLCLYTGQGSVRLIQGTLAMPPKDTDDTPPEPVNLTARQQQDLNNAEVNRNDDAIRQQMQDERDAAQRVSDTLGGTPMSEASETMQGTE